MKKRKPKFMISEARVKIDYKDDPILLESLMRVIYLALALSDKTDKEAKDIQNKLLAQN